MFGTIHMSKMFEFLYLAKIRNASAAEAMMTAINFIVEIHDDDNTMAGTMMNFRSKQTYIKPATKHHNEVFGTIWRHAYVLTMWHSRHSLCLPLAFIVSLTIFEYSFVR